VEVENVAVLASAREDIEGLVRKVNLLEGELAEARRAREVAEENFHGLSDAVADGARRLAVSERECYEQFEELTLLQTWGSKLFLAIIGPPRVRNHLSEGIRAAALHHTKMARELATLQVAVSSAIESMLGRSPDGTFSVEVVGELAAKFQRLEERRS
jgi:hypothetical protein